MVLVLSVDRANEIRRQKGIPGLLVRGVQHAYNNFVRPLLPARGRPRFNGVQVAAENHEWRRPHLFDDLVPWETPVDDYKETNLQAVKSYVEIGDDVVVVGGGFGVTSVVSATIVGESGSVVVFEGSEDRADALKTTFKVNGVSDVCEVRHAIVGEAIDVKGDVGGASVVAPDELGEADILELDCEGAEKGILQGLADLPDRIIVETHPSNGAPTEETVQILTGKGYEIVEIMSDPIDGDIVVARR